MDAARIIETPFGHYTAWCQATPFGDMLTRVTSPFHPARATEEELALGHGNMLLLSVEKTLWAYFSGTHVVFEFPLLPIGTDFQQKVRQAITAIPYGETWTYGEIASAIGRPRAVRAVGTACRMNPFHLVVPCHRVTGVGGRLAGYFGGHTGFQQKLLNLERGRTNLS